MPFAARGNNSMAIAVLLITGLALTAIAAIGQSPSTNIPELVRNAQDPPPIFRPVPLWWWDGDELDSERLLWQLNRLHEKGVDQVCLIYLAPLRSNPPYFTEAWWKLYQEMVNHAASLGMKVWLTDGVAWGSPYINNSVLEVNADFRGQLLRQQETTATGPASVLHEIPKGYEVTEVLGAYAYRVTATGIDPNESHDLTPLLEGRKLAWEAPEGKWKLMIFYTKPMGYQGNEELGFGKGWGIDYTNPEAMKTLIDLTTGEYGRRVTRHIGDTIVGTFQDELVTHHHYGFPPYPKRLSEEFRKRKGYHLQPLLGALYYDAGRITDKVRCDYFEVMTELYEEAFYKPYFEWHEKRGLMISHDQFGRLDLISQTRGYLDYFRTQSWFHAPGYDDWGEGGPGRNWKDAKLAASISQLYGRDRVWVEALHSAGWGLDLLEQVQTINENYIYGANIYDKHGFDYSTSGSWYNWAPPSAHYRMPYWIHYRPFADYVTRLSYLQSQGDHVVDVGVFYPVHSIQANMNAAGRASKRAALTEAYFWRVGRHLLDHQIDFHYVNDASIQKASVAGGWLATGGVKFSTLILPPITTIDRRSLSKIEEFVRGGGLLVSLALTPDASTQEGRGDAQVRAAVERIFGTANPSVPVEQSHPGGGQAVFVPKELDDVPEIIRSRRPADFETDAPGLMYQHRRTEDHDVYMLYNNRSEKVSASVRVRSTGVPFRFDSLSGNTRPVYVRESDGTHTTMQLEFDPYQAFHVYFDQSASAPALDFAAIDELEEVTQEDGSLTVVGWHRSSPNVRIRTAAGRESRQRADTVEEIPLVGKWGFELQPTMDNQWGDFRLPASDEEIGAEVRRFSYRSEPEIGDGTALGWHGAGFDDGGWETYAVSEGPYWWVLGPVPNRGAKRLMEINYGPEHGVDVDRTYRIFGRQYRWRPYSFSLTHGAQHDPDYFNALGSKNRVNETFVELGEGGLFSLSYLFTNVFSPRARAAVLAASTSGYWDTHKVWINGQVVSDGFHRDLSGQYGSVLQVNLTKGWNTVLIKTNRRRRSTKLSIYFIEQDRALEEASSAPNSGPPRLEQFAATDLIYDIYGGDSPGAGWYRFGLPPGTTGLTAKIDGKATFFVDGEKAAYDAASGSLRLAKPLLEGGMAAIRVEHEPGKYAGAAIPEPIRVQTSSGVTSLGDWSDDGLLSYSGAAVYRKTVHLPAEYRGKKLILDLGRVETSASVRVNGREVGVRGWGPYRFDITSAVRPGQNEIEVTVANSLGNHYLTSPSSVHVYEDQEESGLFGPVRILPYSRVELTIGASAQ